MNVKTKRNNPTIIHKPKKALVRYTDLPRIKSVAFPRGYIMLNLTDGSIVKRPIKNYPRIASIPINRRKRVHVSGGVAVDFDDATEVYHISDFLGGDIKDWE